MPRSAPRVTKSFRLYLFGAFRLEMCDGALTRDVRLPRRKVESLLAYLALHPVPGGQPREKLAALLWGDHPDGQARASLRTSLAVLRKTLGADAIVTEHDRVLLNPALSLWTDVLEFQRERAIEQHIMVCELARGNRAGALAQYHACERTLREELAIEPSTETRALYQWLQQTSTPLTSIAARLTNLPIPLTSFIGRKAEMTHIKQTLTHTRLLTLVGAGGSGKTRLALQVALELLDAFRDGIWWVELAPLTSPDLVVYAVLKALGLSEEARLNPSETLRHFLRDKDLLIVLDNCEHVVDACAQLVENILQTCPTVTVLATSREALAMPGETVWQVPTLPVPKELPTHEQLLLAYESIRLFVERAQAVKSHFALTADNAAAVIHVCRRLDGIPLAIELAAAQVAVMAVSDIAARLDDRFNLLTRGARTALPRQQTLRALIDWSYELLTDDERVLFRRLAVFAAKFSLEAAEAVCADARLPRTRLLHGLAQLAAKSLLLISDQTDHTRFYLLETIRQYAYEKLIETGEADKLHQRHWEWYSHVAAQAAKQVRGADQLAWLDRLEADYADLRAALDWAHVNPPSTDQTFQTMTANLGQFWLLRGCWHEGRDRLKAALHMAGPLASRARILLELSELTKQLDGQLVSAPLFEETLTTYRALNDRWGIALTLTHLIVVDLDWAQALSLFDECLALVQALDNGWLMAMAHLRMGLCALRTNQAAVSVAYQKPGLATYDRQHGRLGRLVVQSGLYRFASRRINTVPHFV